MAKRLILFTIALLLILTFALAQDQQDSNRKPPQQAGDSNNNNDSGNQQQNKPPKDQQNNGKQGRPNNNSESSQQSSHNNNHRRVFHFGVIFSFMVYLISLNVVCGVGIALITLKNKYYSISIQKKETHQSLREEEEMPSQYLPQVPVVNVMIQPKPSIQSSQPIGVLSIHSTTTNSTRNPEQKV